MSRTSYLLILVVGLVALVAQTVWYRYASQILGQSALTVAAVVAMALTGLALGNAWGGKFAKRSPGWYAAAMGLSVLLAQVSLRLLPYLEPALESHALIWSLIVASPLLVINFFAGAVFPRLLSNEVRPPIVGRLSALETLGGCVGAIFAGCFAMQTLGLMPTLMGAGLLALVMGVGSASREADPRKRDNASIKIATQASKIHWSIAAAVLISGVASLGLEVVWHRLLILIVGTDSYSYAIVVTSYLSGIAIGAAISAGWLRIRPDVSPEKRLVTVAWLQMMGSIASVITLAGIIYLASGAGQLWTSEPLLGYSLPLLKRFLLCAGLLIIPTSLQGACFPLIVDAISVENENLASPASRIYGLLAAGNVVGILICGFFLVPRYGLQHSVLVLSIIAAAAALIYSGRKIRWGVLALLAVLIFLCGHRWMENEAIGLAINPDKTNRLFYREGPANTVAVLAEKANPDVRRLTVDGIIVGQSGRNAEEKQLMLAHLPALLNHQSHAVKSAVVIGLGSGLLSAEVASIPDVQTVTSLELSPAVIEANAFFADLMPAPVSATKNVIQTDGIHWLKKAASSNQKFDAIISDGKSRPGHVGNAAFFSSDYYRSARESLSPHGKFVQWYSLDGALRETKTVLRTFAAAFPHARVAIAAPDSVYLIGSLDPIQLNPAAADDYFNSKTADSLSPYQWHTADDLRSMGWVRLTPDHPLLKDEKVNSLGRPILERFSFDVRPKTLQKNKLENLRWLQDLLTEDASSLGLFTDEKLSQLQLRTAARHVIECFTVVIGREKGWLDEAADRLKPVYQTLPRLQRGALLGNSYLVAAEIAESENDRQREITMLGRAGDLFPADAATRIWIGQRLLQLEDAESALPHFLDAVKYAPYNSEANKGAATALVIMQKVRSAEPYFQTAITDPSVRLDKAFMKLESLFEKKVSPVTPDTDIDRKPTTEQEMLDQLKNLLKEPTEDE